MKGTLGKSSTQLKKTFMLALLLRSACIKTSNAATISILEKMFAALKFSLFASRNERNLQDLGQIPLDLDSNLGTFPPELVPGDGTLAELPVEDPGILTFPPQAEPPPEQDPNDDGDDFLPMTFIPLPTLLPVIPDMRTLMPIPILDQFPIIAPTTPPTIAVATGIPTSTPTLSSTIRSSTLLPTLLSTNIPTEQATVQRVTFQPSLSIVSQRPTPNPSQQLNIESPPTTRLPTTVPRPLPKLATTQYPSCTSTSNMWKSCWLD
jgi:hypothetical protein